MANTHIFIMAGLGTAPSNGIIYNLAARLVALNQTAVRVGSYADYIRFASEARALPPTTFLVQVGHSLGASAAPEWARLVQRSVSAIFGFDPAKNLAADSSQYRLTQVPRNVVVAKAVYIPGGGLGGGWYEAEDPTATFVENFPIDTSHTTVEESIEHHLEIEEFVRRLTEVPVNGT